MNTKALKEIVKRAQQDPAFFHALVFEAEVALAHLPKLEKSAKDAVRASSPEDFIAGLIGETNEFGMEECGSTCISVTCLCTGGTCVGPSCDSSCAFTLQEAPFAAGIIDAMMACGGGETCSCTSGTCSGTCGGSTCSATCTGDSCGRTCDNSCGYTTNFERGGWQEYSDPRELGLGTLAEQEFWR